MSVRFTAAAVPGTGAAACPPRFQPLTSPSIGCPHFFGAIMIPSPRTRSAAGALALLWLIAGCSSPSNTFTEASPAATVTVTATPDPAPAGTSSPGPADTGAPLDPEGTVPAVGGDGQAGPKPHPAYATKAIDLLATLPIKGRAPQTGYNRDLFGQAWADVDRNGCDTRNDILKRDLTQVTYTNSVPCKVQTGLLADPYTGTSIKFVCGSTTSAAIQIDHVIALGDAWQKGAQQLTPAQRTAFSNDPLNLQATDGPTNQKKGDGDAATWLPPNTGFRCEYVARQISVKATYNLWVTQAEHDAMARILGSCPDQLAPTNQPAPAPALPREPAPPAPAPAPEPAPAPVVPALAAPAPASAYYANCTAAKAAGAAPLYAG